MTPRNPPTDFPTAALDLAAIPPGRRFGRIYHQRFADPLGWGPGRSRFSDPRPRGEGRFGVVYLGSSLKVCFLEAVLRDAGDGRVGDYLMAEAELDARLYAEIEVQAPLALVDLTGDHAVRQGVPSDVVRASRQAPARRWSLAFHQHPQDIDGILYPSRLNGEVNLALYDRALPKVAAVAVKPLRRAAGLAQVLDGLAVALI